MGLRVVFVYHHTLGYLANHRYYVDMQKLGLPGFAPETATEDGDGILHFVLRGNHSLEQDVILIQAIDDYSARRRAIGQPALVIVDLSDVAYLSFRTKQHAAEESLRFDVDGLCYVSTNNSTNTILLRLVLKLFDPNRFHLSPTVAEARKWLFAYNTRERTANRRPTDFGL
jgi:hypothetical protein